MPDSGPPLASVTIDVDTLGRDFFVDVMSNESRYALQRVTYDRVVPRILDWLDTIGTRATFFVVGVDAAACGDAVGEIARRGHEVANHTWSHPKHFAQLHEPEMADEIRRAHDVIARTTGIAPVGLRTPGYTVTPSVVNVLQTIGYAYDASLVPSWSYSALKHAFRIFGGRRYRESLVVQNLASAWAPKRPFTTDSSHRAPGVAGVTEIPLTTVPVLQLPLIYGLYGRFGPAVQRLVESGAGRRAFVSVAYHDFEFAVEGDFGARLPGLLSAPHTRVSLDTRLAWMAASVERFARRFRFVPLNEVARVHQELGHPA